MKPNVCLCICLSPSLALYICVRVCVCMRAASTLSLSRPRSRTPCALQCCYSAVAVNIFHIINTFSVDITNNNFCSPTPTHRHELFLATPSCRTLVWALWWFVVRFGIEALFTSGPHSKMTALVQDTLRACVCVLATWCACASITGCGWSTLIFFSMSYR